MKIAAWLYIAILVAMVFARIDWQTEISNPYDVDRLLVFVVAGLLMRLAYPQAPSFACIVMIASVCGLNLAHYAATGVTGSPLHAIVSMAGALWGVVLGALFGMLRLSLSKRSPSF